MIAETMEEGDVEETVAAGLDQDFYLRAHPELEAAGVDPVKHYLAEGHGQGLWPTADFDSGFYLSRSPDVAGAGLNGFFHYLRWGRVEGRAPNAGALEAAAEPGNGAERLIRPHVDEAFYFEARPDIGATHVAAYKHYLHFGWHGDLDPSPDFSTRFYRSTPYDTDAHENPLHHFRRVGRMRGRLPRPLLGAGVDMHGGAAVEAALRPEFDADFYRAAYPEAAKRGDPLTDYLERGWREGRDPAPWFSTADYRARFPDAETVANPFLHYLLWGRAQGFPPASGPVGARTVVRDRGASVASAELRPIALKQAAPESLPEEGPPTVPTRLDLHWIIPEVEGPGRGGHMTLFRLVRWLEIFGHRCTVWINDPHPDWTDEARRELIQRSYQAIAARVRVLPEAPVFAPDAVVTASSWTTALVLNAIPSARRRFYLVQDDERSFHPAGAKALAAERTYDLDMGYLCAGSWLAETLARTRGRWTRAFDLAPDERQHPPTERPARERPRIAFYARRHTDRRAVELGLLALQRLAESGAEFEVRLFGSDTPLDAAPFPAVDHGVVDPESLAELYRDCDIGLCFSATNPSLIPQEMMACGLPVVELDAPGTRAVFPPGVITLAGPEPDDIAAALRRMLDLQARRAQAERALAWVSGLSWERSARAVEAAVLERLTKTGARLRPRAEPIAAEPPVASVVIPTLNGGAEFARVLDRVLAQRTPWPFEVVVVDSASDDGTWERVRDHPAVRALSIPRERFQHGPHAQSCGGRGPGRVRGLPDPGRGAGRSAVAGRSGRRAPGPPARGGRLRPAPAAPGRLALHPARPARILPPPGRPIARTLQVPGPPPLARGRRSLPPGAPLLLQQQQLSQALGVAPHSPP
jgi:glycosyltransferase involved in cell wall biosynthesis